MTTREVLKSVYFMVEVSVGAPVVWVRRLPETFPTVEVQMSAWQDVFNACDMLGREQYVLLLDMREGPSRNDPAFEATATEIRLQMRRGFPKGVALVKSASGLLQMKRYAREPDAHMPGHTEVFHEEDKALAYLLAKPR